MARTTREVTEFRMWSASAASGFTIPLDWPHSTAVQARTWELLANAQAEKAPWLQEASMVREYLVSRGLAPMEWLDRAYKGNIKPPDVGALPRIHHDAFLVLAHDPVRMQAAEALAMSIFPSAHYQLTWTTCQTAYVAARLGTLEARGPRMSPTSRVARLSVRGVTGTKSGALAEVDLSLTHHNSGWDAKSFAAQLTGSLPDWKPLIEMGVVPWVHGDQERRQVALVVPPRQRLYIRWVPIDPNVGTVFLPQSEDYAD